jgi:hypothetical protein
MKTFKTILPLLTLIVVGGLLAYSILTLPSVTRKPFVDSKAELRNEHARQVYRAVFYDEKAIENFRKATDAFNGLEMEEGERYLKLGRWYGHMGDSVKVISDSLYLKIKTT